MTPRQDPKKTWIRGLYAITDTSLMPEQGFAEQAEAALRGGARILQYRDKSNDAVRRLHQAIGLLSVCQRHGALLVINDDIDLAQRIGAPAVHIGQSDCALDSARMRLGPDVLIGVSCHNQLSLALAAQAGGADYVAFGAFSPSRTKPDAPLATPDLLNQAKRQLDLPLVAIGGITPDSGGFLLRAGADALAVITGIFGHSDIEAQARRYTRLFSKP